MQDPAVPKEPRAEQDGPEKEMSFWEHLDELRAVLFRCLIAIVVMMIAAFVFKEFIFDKIILAPKNADFITYRALCKLGTLISMHSLCFDTLTLNLININLAGQFLSHMTVSIVAGLIVSTPYIIWEFWRFIRPGLTPFEVRYTRGAVFIISALFMTGILFSYFLVIPVMVNFLGNYHVSASVTNQIALNSYVGSVTTMTLLMGLIFEFPIIVLFLTRIGILNPSLLKKYRKHTIIIILIASGIITPSPDIFSQLLVSVPLYLLYEISLVISTRIFRKRKELAG